MKVGIPQKVLPFRMTALRRKLEPLYRFLHIWFIREVSAEELI